MQSDRLRLMAKVARLTHEQGLRQVDIAEALHISQARVSRLLKEAADAGIVRTVVVLPEGVHPGLEEEIARRYGLIDVVVVDTDGAGADPRQSIGAAAADYLDATLTGGDVIGVSTWSGTILAAVESLRPKARPVADRVIQLFGGVGRPEAQVQATRITGRLAEVTGAQPVFVPTPGVVGSAAIREAMLSDPSVAAVAAQWADVTMSVVGIGSLSPSPLLQVSGNAITTADQVQLRERGAVGDVCLRYFDAQGERVVGSLDDRVLGIDADQLRAIPRRVALAGGIDKASAIRAALLGGWVNVLITDLAVARRLVA